MIYDNPQARPLVGSTVPACGCGRRAGKAACSTGPVAQAGSLGQDQNSRVVLMPGAGTGYLPFLSGISGEAEARVSLSMPGPNSWSTSSMFSYLTIRPVWQAIRPMEVT